MASSLHPYRHFYKNKGARSLQARLLKTNNKVKKPLTFTQRLLPLKLFSGAKREEISTTVAKRLRAQRRTPVIAHLTRALRARRGRGRLALRALAVRALAVSAAHASVVDHLVGCLVRKTLRWSV